MSTIDCGRHRFFDSHFATQLPAPAKIVAGHAGNATVLQCH